MLKRLRAFADALRGKRRSVKPLRPTAALGIRGEQAAADYLSTNGYRILARNFRVRQGELDIVAFRTGVMAFVEVRSQSLPSPLDPVLTVTLGKQRRVERAARIYLTRHRAPAADVAMRFDVITVRFPPDGGKPDIKHYEGAFEAPRRSF